MANAFDLDLVPRKQLERSSIPFSGTWPSNVANWCVLRLRGSCHSRMAAVTSSGGQPNQSSDIVKVNRSEATPSGGQSNHSGKWWKSTF